MNSQVSREKLAMVTHDRCLSARAGLGIFQMLSDISEQPSCKASIFPPWKEESLSLNNFLHEQWGRVELLVPEGNVKRQSGLWADDTRGQGYFSSQW